MALLVEEHELQSALMGYLIIVDTTYEARHCTGRQAGHMLIFPMAAFAISAQASYIDGRADVRQHADAGHERHAFVVAIDDAATRLTPRRWPRSRSRPGERESGARRRHFASAMICRGHRHARRFSLSRAVRMRVKADFGR